MDLSKILKANLDELKTVIIELADSGEELSDENQAITF